MKRTQGTSGSRGIKMRDRVGGIRMEKGTGRQGNSRVKGMGMKGRKKKGN